MGVLGHRLANFVHFPFSSLLSASNRTICSYNTLLKPKNDNLYNNINNLVEAAGVEQSNPKSPNYLKLLDPIS